MSAFGTFPPTGTQAVVRRMGRWLPNNWLGQRAAGWLRALIQATARRPVDVHVLGQRMRLHLTDNACERRLMVTPHFFDPQELALLESEVVDGCQFVDLGANVGTYSLFVTRRAGVAGRILAIEPQAVVIARLRANIALNGFTNIAVAPYAVADADRTVAFAVDLNNRGNTSLHLGRKGRGTTEVAELPCRTLLSLVREHGFDRIDALKADIEGAEDLALIPFFETSPVSLWPRLIILENSPREWRRDCITYLEGCGYTVLWQQANAVLRLTSTTARAENDAAALCP